jgi:SAM-dependent methyltransferase
MASAEDRRSHWNDVYATRGSAVSWFERAPRISLGLIDALGVTPDEAVVDVGGGASPLAGALVRRGFADVTVVDVSEVALRAARRDLGPAAAGVRWIRADVLDWDPGRAFGLWHDRAAFHFLVDPAARERYLATAAAAVRPGGHLVLGTFAEDGPARCSGLPVARYDVAALRALLAPAFALVEGRRAGHRTPRGARQAFTWASFVREP